MQNNDQVTLVDEQDQVIGSMDKIEAHRGEGKLHRASSVFLFRKNSQGNSELLIQQRSNKKIVGAGQWANTVCGNVWPDESYEACARRRLQFELGIEEKIELQDVVTFRYQAKCNEEFSENEIVHIFVGWFEGEVSPNPDEVFTTQWIAWKEAISLPEKLDWAPWFKLFVKESGIVTELERKL